jgi:hypothetical protein
LRDPTQPGPQLRQILAPAAVAGSSNPTAMPHMSLKARVIRRGQPGTALLEIDGMLHAVHEDEEITVATGRTGLITLRVVKLTAATVRVELEPYHRTLVLN